MLYDFQNDVYDIIIQAGQSNSVGFGFGQVKEPFLPNGNIWYMTANVEPYDGFNHNYVISQAEEKVWGNETISNYALTFADSYLKMGLLKAGRKLLILRTAVGGTSFLGGQWNPEGVLYLRMMDMIRTALGLNPNNRLVALLWHQGETDAELGASYHTHYQNLSFLLNSVRQEFDVPNLPFIAGDFVQHWKDTGGVDTQPVLHAIRAVCEEKHGRFVETEGLLSNYQENNRVGQWEGCVEDPIHFSRSSQYELGHRYFAAFQEITSEK